VQSLALKAAFFDLDGTLKLERDPYVFIHRRLGLQEAASALPILYQKGEIDSDEWIRRDVALWKGVHRNRLVELLREIPYLPGAAGLVRALQMRGVVTAAVSSGLQIHADMVRADLGLDYALANELKFDHRGICRGEVLIRVHETAKADVVRDIMRREGLPPDACVAIGDGEADVGMFELCRVGIAVQPVSSHVRAAADIVVEQADLTGVLDALDRYVSERSVGM
jgi:phosphoserine phosphatase